MLAMLRWHLQARTARAACCGPAVLQDGLPPGLREAVAEGRQVLARPASDADVRGVHRACLLYTSPSPRD
eukprot:12947399-Alexandrium_andersonii.AAC.1